MADIANSIRTLGVVITFDAVGLFFGIIFLALVIQGKK